jgi:hypothetical protein
MTAWNDFVKKIYHEGHNKDSNYSFKQALKDASARKSEMGKTGSVTKTETAMGVKSKSSKSSKKSRKSRKSAKKSKKSKTQRRRK